MQLEVNYLHGGIAVVTVEGLTREDFFDGIVDASSSDDLEAIRASGTQLISRMRQYLPQFADNTVTFGERQREDISSGFYYAVNLQGGRINAYAQIHDDLGKELLDHPFFKFEGKRKREEISDKFEGKSGAVIWGTYHWKGNEGKGLQLGRGQNFSESGGSENKYSLVFRTALNALCQRVDLTEAVAIGNWPLYNPLYYVGGTKEITALVKDVSLKAVRAADQPVGEFMNWMHKNAVQVNTLGEYVRLALFQYIDAKEQGKIAPAGRVAAILPQIVKETGDKLFQLAQEAYAELHPPQNNRMDYLVN